MATPGPSGSLNVTLPFLKWAGGKRWLAPLLAATIEVDDESRYVEPFLGAGSAFFALSPTLASLSDANEELIETFRVVRDNPEGLIRSLRSRPVDRSYFDQLRTRVSSGRVARAARVVYLNRTGFNGLYRVNQRGEFNVPFGCKPGTVPCDPSQIRSCSAVLRGVSLETLPFRSALHTVAANAVVYLDPPYTVAHNNNGFVRYNERLFRWEDQVDLATWARGFASAGGRVVVTNAAHDEVVRQYPKRWFHRFATSRPSRMAASPKHRRNCTELLVVSRAVGTHSLVEKGRDLGVTVSHLDE